MKINNFLFLITIMVFFQLNSLAQGKLVYLNGKEKRFASAEVKGEFIVYKPEGEDNVRKADKYSVFSIKKDDGTEQIIYDPDTASGEDLTIAEVRDYIKGEKYASIAYQKPINLVSGMQVGFITGITVPVFYGLAVPLIYPAIFGRFTPKVKTPLTYKYDPNSDTYMKLPDGSEEGEKVVTEAFAAGYGKKARNLKIKHSMIGTSIGLGIGVTSLLLILNNAN